MSLPAQNPQSESSPVWTEPESSSPKSMNIPSIHRQRLLNLFLWHRAPHSRRDQDDVACVFLRKLDGGTSTGGAA